MADTTERAGVAWRRLNTVGIGNGRVFSNSASFVHPTPLQPNIEKVVIRWNPVLEDVVQKLNGSQPVYTPSKMNGFNLAHVRFRVPMDINRTVFEQVDTAGIPCAEVWHAESTAACSALDQLQCGPFRSRIFDVSRLRCDEMEKCTYRDLLKTGEMVRAVKLLLSDWEDDMLKTELYYKEMYEQVLDSVRRGVDGTNSQTLSDAANWLYKLNKDRYVQFSKLTRELEQIKGTEWDIRTRADRHFHGRSHDRSEIQGLIPRDIKLPMKVVLDEMITSLDWYNPAFRYSTEGTNLHVCEVLLISKCDVADTGTRTTAIADGRGSSSDEALENACQHALLMLDTKMSIRLLDVNYSLRAHAEVYVSEAKEVVKRAAAIGTKVITEWEIMADELQACKEHFWSLAEDHPEKEPWNQMYNAKCECVGTLTDLHRECTFDLDLAKDRHVCLSTWTDQ